MTDAIVVRGANKRYGDFAALDNVDFEVPAGSLTALLGPSGSGKSTLLRIISGFIRQTEGRVRFDDAAVDALSPSERGVRKRSAGARGSNCSRNPWRSTLQPDERP